MGKTHSKPLAARHGRGTAWALHGKGMLCVNRPDDVYTTTKSPNDAFFRTYPRRFATRGCIVIVLEREKECLVFEDGSEIISAEIQLSLTAVT